jgi:DNA-binding NarL/FixJ family response regulator
MARRLTGSELLAMQLRATGYSVAQIAAMMDCGEDEVRAAVERAAEALDARDERQAIETARRRGLIDS